MIERIRWAILTPPTGRDWAIALGLLLVYTAITYGIGFGSRFLIVEPVTAWKEIGTTIAIALVFPAIVEEILFRVILLPHPLEFSRGEIGLVSLTLWSTICLGVFILAHPLNALIFFPSRKPTFCNPIFLLLAGLLGLICTVSYLQSGSFWLPMLLHWILVVVWLLYFGGAKRMTPIGQ